MKLYSRTDMVQAVQELLVGKGFQITRSVYQHGIVEAVQREGNIEQRFKIKVEYGEDR